MEDNMRDTSVVIIVIIVVFLSTETRLLFSEKILIYCRDISPAKNLNHIYM